MMFRGWILKLSNKNGFSNWAYETSRILMEFYHDCWERRNLVEFGETRETQIKIKKEQLLNRITFAYEVKDVMFEKNDSWVNLLFQRKCNRWETVTVKEMQDWIKTYEQTLERRAIRNFDISEWVDTPEELAEGET